MKIKTKMDRNKIKMNKNLLIVLAFLLFNIGYAQNLKTWTGATSTAWNVDTNWSPEGRPTAGDNVLITSAANQPVISIAGAACAILELSNSTAGSLVVLTVSGGSFSPASIIMNSTGGTSACSLSIDTGKVTVTGNVTMNGTPVQNNVTFTGEGNLLIGGVMTGGILNAGTPASGKGTVAYNGTGTRAVGAYTYNNLTISGSGVRTITPSVIVNGVLAMAGTATASAAPTYGANASLQYNSASSLTVGPEWITPFIANGGVQISSVTGTSTVTLNNNGVGKKFNDGVSLVIDEEASLIATNTDLYFGGDFVNNNGSLRSDGFVYLTGAVNQTIDGFTAAKGVTMNKTAGVATFTQGLNTGKLTIEGAGTLNLGAGLTHSFTDWVRTQGTLNANSSLLKFSGNVTGTGGNFIPGTSTVEFNGGAQNLGTGLITYNNLTLSGSGIKTFGAKTTINETISIVSGVVADLTANLVHTAKSIKLGVTAGSGGSWGSSFSNAVNKNNTFFSSNNGIINVGPTIVISTDSLSALTTTYGTPSSSNSFDLSGLAMLEAILVTPPSGFEVSTDGINFSNTLTIGAAGAIASTKVYVRLKGTIDAKDYSGNLVLTSNGTTTINIPIATSTVNKAVLKIKTVSTERFYGDDNPVLTVIYDKFENGDTADKLTALPKIITSAVKTSAVTSAVNKYEITAEGAASSNYTFDYSVKGELKINPAEVTITVQSTERQRGEVNPTFTLEYSEFKNGEGKAVLTKQPTITTAAVKDSPVGNYDIIVDGAEALNYTFKYIKGNLKVKKSSNAGLGDLTTSEGTLSPAFAEGTKDYTVKVPNNVDGIKVTPTTADTEATVTVNGKEVPSGTASGNIPLEVGENTITTVVTAEDGTTSTYTIVVTREPSSDAGLGDLTISEGTLSPAFAEG
ncbi:MBG domain-containing protein, partial [Pseudomonas shirazensis]